MRFTFSWIIASTFIFNISWQDKNSLSESIKRGSELYKDFCVTCHRSDGKGMGNMIPPLASADYLINERNESIKAVKYGQKGKIKVNEKEYNGLMPDLGLEDQEVVDIMNYILNSWGNSSPKKVTLEEVIAIKK